MSEASSSALPRLATVEVSDTLAGGCCMVLAASYLATTDDVHRASVSSAAHRRRDALTSRDLREERHSLAIHA